MSPRFLAMIPFLWEWEGTKFENDPDDPGGATKFGIDKRSHPHEDIRNLTETRAKEIYWDEYWQKNRCESFPAPMGEIIFNTCVNCGAGRVAKIFAAGGKAPNSFLYELADFYRRLATARPASHKYLKGWLDRTRGLAKFLKVSLTPPI